MKHVHRVPVESIWWLPCRGLRAEILAIVGLALSLSLTARCTSGQTNATICSVQDMAWQGSCYLWVCNSNTISRYDVCTGNTRVHNYSCESILIDSEGTVWISSGDSVRMFRDETWLTFTCEDGLAGNWYDGVLLEASDGTIWIGGSGLSRYDPTTKAWRTLISPLSNVPSGSSSGSFDEVYEGGITALLQASDGAIWAASTQGVIRLDNASRQTWTVSEGLADNIARALLEAQDRTIWAGTDQGISRWNGNTWQTLPYAIEADTDGYRITDILLEKSDNTVWATTWEGVARWDGSVWQAWPVARGLPHHEGVRALLETRDGILWVGTWGGGVKRWDGDDWRSYTVTDGLSANRVQVLLESPDGTLWAGTFGGVSHYDPRADQWRAFPE
jgi:ligand-binding sensor domain-containing protein